MNTRAQHDPEHERELEQLWASEGGGATAQVRAALSACPACAALWAEFEATAARVERTLEQQSNDLRAAHAGGAAPGEERLEQMLLGAIHRRSPRTRWRTYALAAAVTLAVGVGLFRAFEQPPTQTDPELGTTLVLVAPLELTAARDRFVFEAADDGGWFEVEVLDAGDGRVVARSGRLERSPWLPTDEQRQAIPAEYQWRVTAFDASGSIEARSSARMAR